MDRYRLFKHVPLCAAAVQAYHALMGRPMGYRDVPEMNQTLHQVARALSQVAPIFTLEGGAARPLGFNELENGVFERGALNLRRRDGSSCSHLTIERADLRAGIGILKRAGMRFSAPAPQRSERVAEPSS